MTQLGVVRAALCMPIPGIIITFLAACSCGVLLTLVVRSLVTGYICVLCPLTLCVHPTRSCLFGGVEIYSNSCHTGDCSEFAT